MVPVEVLVNSTSSDPQPLVVFAVKFATGWANKKPALPMSSSNMMNGPLAHPTNIVWNRVLFTPNFYQGSREAHLLLPKLTPSNYNTQTPYDREIYDFFDFAHLLPTNFADLQPDTACILVDLRCMQH